MIARTCEGLDLFSHDINASIVAGIELEYHLTHVLGSINPPREGEDCGCFASTGRTIEEEMR